MTRVSENQLTLLELVELKTIERSSFPSVYSATRAWKREKKGNESIKETKNEGTSNEIGELTT